MTDNKQKNAEDTFNYVDGRFNKESVIAFMKEYRSIREMGIYSYDVNSHDLTIAFEMALMTDVMSSDEREALALVYGLELTYVQASQMMGQKVSDFKGIVDNAFEVVEAVLNGYPSSSLTPSISRATNLNEYIQEVRNGLILPFSINKAVNTSLLHYLAGKKDVLSIETLKQQAEGAPLEGENGLFDIMGMFPYSYERYPYYATNPSIESADMDENKFRAYDYFRSKDAENGVVSTGEIHRLSKNFLSNGNYKKKKTDEDTTKTRGEVY